MLGLALGDQGEIRQALDTFQESVSLYEQVGNTRSSTAPLNNMARLLAVRGDYDASLECLRKALEICESTGPKANIPSILMNIGNIYADRGNFRLALSMTERARRFFRVPANRVELPIA